MKIIREYRIKKHLTQGDLAEEMKVAKSTVAMWETGRRQPRLSKLRKLSVLLEVPVEKLISSITEDDTKSG